MKEKFRKGLIGAGSLFVVGHIIYFIGVWNAREIAISWSRPQQATSWSTSPEQTDAVFSFFSLLGISIVVVAVLMMVIVFYKWLGFKEE
ncbi:hypothetical protein ACFSTA_09525 [Ornithinibacillus salinisoli]|uniref:Uncharacterized protein n=1 Tax=Ornithinibacillus salinisoli TaxID=1848459 RepID=A0ABW4W0S1_9BACI